MKKMKGVDFKELTWMIPSAIDLPTLIKTNKPNFQYRIGYFYHIIETICNKMEYLDPDDPYQWVRLSAVKLKGFNKHYNKYLTYLQENGVIITNNWYIPGQKCKGYRIAEP